MYNIDEVMAQVKKHNPGEEEFHQAVKEVFEDVIPFLKNKPQYEKVCHFNSLRSFMP